MTKVDEARGQIPVYNQKRYDIYSLDWEDEDVLYRKFKSQESKESENSQEDKE